MKKIKAGKYIKCFLNNGSSVEGKIISWLDDELQIHCTQDDSLTIIYNPEQQIFLTKVYISENKQKNQPVDIGCQIEEELSKPSPHYKEENTNYAYPGFFKNGESK